MAEGDEGGVVFGGEASEGCGLQEPGGAVVVLLVAGEAGEARGGEPVEIGGEPGLEGREVFGGKRTGGFEEWKWTGRLPRAGRFRGCPRSG